MGFLRVGYQPLLPLDLCADDMCLSYSSLVLKVLLSASQMNLPSCQSFVAPCLDVQFETKTFTSHSREREK